MESPGGKGGSTPGKRKRTPALSPRRGKRKLSLTEVRKHVNSPTQAPKRKSNPGSSQTTTAGKTLNTIQASFAKAKPPQYAACPVCEQQVKLSEINKHLDLGCLSQGSSLGVTQVHVGRSPENARKIADMRTELKDKRTRRRLQEKFEHSPIYKHSSSSSSSEEGHSVLSTIPKTMPRNNQEAKQNCGHDASESKLEQTPCSSTSERLSNPKVPAELMSSQTTLPQMPSCLEDRPSGRALLSLKKIRERRKQISYTETSEGTSPKNNSKKIARNQGQNTSPYFKSKFSNTASSEQYSGDRVSTARNQRSDTVDEALQHEHFGSGNRNTNQHSPREAMLPSSTPTRSIGECSKKSCHDITDAKDRLPVMMPSNNETNRILSPEKQSFEDMVLETSLQSKPSFSSTSASFSSPSSVTEAGSVECITSDSSLTHRDSNMSGNTSSNSPDKDHCSPLKVTLVDPPNRMTLPTTPLKSGAPLGSPYSGTAWGSPARSSASAVSPARSQTLGSPHKPREPYYMVNFKLILNAVLKNEYDSHLFNNEDHEHIAKFNSLSSPAQQLYVRLFQRKYTWFRVAKLEYPRIANDLRPMVKELISAKLVITELALSDLGTTLKLLMAPDLKQIAKDLKIGGGGGGGMQKQDLVAAILKYSSSQRSMFTSNMNGVVLRKAKKLLGHCVKLSQAPRAVFKRVIMLFSLVRQDLMDEDKGSAGQSALYTELLVNMGKMSYPVYTVFRTRSFFASREDVLRYEVAMQYESDIADALAINDFELADRLQTAAMATSREQQDDEQTRRHDESLPEFVRCFTCGWIYTRIGYQGVDIRQKQRRYGEAVALLRALLQQTTYCPDRRGGWWDRLALNLDQHCKKPDKSLDCIREGLADQYTRTGHRLALQQRAQKILASKRKNLAERAAEFQFDDVMEIPKVMIKGTVLPHHGPGVRNTFISSYQGASAADEGIVVCSVEQVALEHYKQLGYTEGIHGEGTTYSTLIFILFWDIVFQADIPDVFCYPYQSAPLDLRTDHFYGNRYDAIQQRLGVLRGADSDQLEAMLQNHWLEYEGDQCVGVSWDIFRDLDHAKDLLRCIGGRILSKMADRILQDHRHCRAGIPDLTVWNPEKKTFRVVEVKGPGDRLSQKQILWLDFFLQLGVDAEVCHVEAVGSKRLKKKVFDSQEVASTSSQESRTSQEEMRSSQDSTASQDSRLSQKPKSSQKSRTRKGKD